MTISSRFDLSDVPDHAIDSLDSILDIASQVLYEYGPEAGDTRIERMARYLVLSLGGAPYASEEAWGNQYFRLGISCVWKGRLGIGFDVAAQAELDVAHAREVAVATLRSIELFESSSQSSETSDE